MAPMCRWIGVAVGVLLALVVHAEDRPVLANKSFSDAAEVIDFGAVVTAVPAALVAETVSRDLVFARALGHRTLRFHPMDKGPDALLPIADGSLEATIQSDITMLEMASRQAIVNIGMYKENFGVVVGPKGSSIADLKGKRVGTPGGGAGHFTLLQALDQSGLSEADVTLVRLAVRDLPDALVSGRIDAFASFEPAPSSVLGRYPDRFSALYRHRAPGYIIVTRKLAEADPEAVRHLAAAFVRAVRWLRKDRANLVRASAWTREAMRNFRAPVLSDKEIIRMTRGDLLDLRDAPRMARNDIEPASLIARNFEFMKKTGQLPATIEWSAIQRSFDFSVMADVLANPKRYRLDEFDYGRR